ncbi:MAG: sigma-54-dependent Fis family transcriptional regulator [Calditrichaeota bacterium]|nr:sigma-54-dependent Fis family transcriptional regulator [Calditrichota bacterium]
MVHFKPKVLIAEDDEAFAEQLSETLKSENYNVIVVHDGSGALKILKNDKVDLGFIDLSMPGIDGMQVLQEAQMTAPDVPLIMITGYASIEKAVQATRLGAYDFIEKPVSLDRLLLTAKHALEKRKLQLKNHWMAEEILMRYEMVGTSEAMQQIYALIDKIAPTNSTVLITGETGTGKELVARALHTRSRRADGPFVQLNCAAIPDNLLESELFGYKKGAFTNAFQDKKGKIEMANQGSLFLDEIGDLSTSSQAKILRTLEDHVITPVGGVDDLEIDVRIFAATNKKLSELIEKGLFRPDLYYRLQTIEISLPALAEKKEDIPELAQHFLKRFCAENNKYIKGFTAGAIHLLMQQEWPGNVRQLKSIIERLVILSNNEEIAVDEISLVLKTQSVMNMRYFETYQEAEHAFQRDFFSQALHAHNWNVSETAKSLKIDRTNLYKKMQKLGIKNEREE